MTASRRGLSLVEVIVALAIVMIAIGILATAIVSNLRVTSTFGARTQTTQYLNYLGRLVSGGTPTVLAEPGTPLEWAYGDMATSFSDLPTGGGGLEEAGRYRGEVENLGDVAFLGANAVQYRVTVCSMTANGESCTVGLTLGPPPSTGIAAPPLPGIN
jgi:type II secretory pathway pseudopilin PulG